MQKKKSVFNLNFEFLFLLIPKQNIPVASKHIVALGPAPTLSHGGGTTSMTHQLCDNGQVV